MRSSLFQIQKADFEEKLSILSLTATESEISLYTNARNIDLLCPLQLWKNIVFLITTKTSGNKRIDQDGAMRALSGMKQRVNESLSDYLQRFINAKDTFTLLDIPLPTEEIMATTYIQGLDPARYTDMLTYLHNELSNGRDLFPTDLASAIAKASKWLVASPKGPREAAQHSVYGAVGKPNNPSKSNKDSKKKDGKGKGKEEKPTDLKPADPSKCDFFDF